MEDKVIKKLKIAGGDDYNNILRMIEEVKFSPKSKIQSPQFKYQPSNL